MKREVRRSFGSFRPQVTHLEDRLQPGSLLTGGASSLLFDSFLDRLSVNQTPTDLGVTATQTSSYEQSDLVLAASQAPAFRLLPAGQETQQSTGTVSLSETSTSTPAFEMLSRQASELVNVASAVSASTPVSQRLETVVNQGGGTITENGKNLVPQATSDTVETTPVVDLPINATPPPQAEVSGPIPIGDPITCGGSFQEDDLFVSFSPHDPIPAYDRDTATVAIAGTDGASWFAGTNTRPDGSGITDAYLTQRTGDGCATYVLPSDGFAGFVGFEVLDGIEAPIPYAFHLVGAATRDTGEVSPALMQIDFNSGGVTLLSYPGIGNLSGISTDVAGYLDVVGTIDPDFTGNRILAALIDPYTFDNVGVTIGDGSVPLEGRNVDTDENVLFHIVGSQNDFTDEKGLFLQLDIGTPAINYGFVWNTLGQGDRTIGPGYGCEAVDVTGGVFSMGCATGPTATFGSPFYNTIVAKVNSVDGSVITGSAWIWQVADGNFWVNDLVIDDGGFMLTAGTISGPVRPSGLFDLDATVVVFDPTGGAIVDDIGYANPDEDTEPREEALSIAQVSSAELSDLYIAGITNAENFEPIINACQATYQGGQDGFIAGLSQPF